MSVCLFVMKKVRTRVCSSVVPSGTGSVSLFPGAEAPGYFQTPLRGRTGDGPFLADPPFFCHRFVEKLLAVPDRSLAILKGTYHVLTTFLWILVDGQAEFP